MISYIKHDYTLEYSIFMNERITLMSILYR